MKASYRRAIQDTTWYQTASASPVMQLCSAPPELLKLIWGKFRCLSKKVPVDTMQYGDNLAFCMKT